jgi:hypothetical protein
MLSNLRRTEPRGNVEVVIVVPSTKEEQLADLYELLSEFNVDNDSFVFEERNVVEHHRLRQPFRVIEQGADPSDFFNDVDHTRYEVTSSVNSHASSGIF